MNNESTESGQTTTQEMREQLEWDRLQNEALAAQRWRLEQEMQQAQREQQPGQSDSDEQSVTELLPWNKLAASAFVILAAVTVAAVVAVVWW